MLAEDFLSDILIPEGNAAAVCEIWCQVFDDYAVALPNTVVASNMLFFTWAVPDFCVRLYLYTDKAFIAVAYACGRGSCP